MERTIYMKKILCILAAVSLLFSTAACGASGSAETAAPDEKQVVPSTGSEKLVIESLINESGVYTDSIGNTSEYRFSLPKVVCDTDYAKCVNEEINDIYEKYILPSFDSMEKGTSLITSASTWQKGSYDGITSIILVLNSTWDSYGAYIWNFDADGNEADNKAVLKAAGLSEDEFVEKAEAILKEEISFDPEGKSDEIINALNGENEKTLAADNLNAEMPMAILDDGSLIFNAKIYSIAGSGIYYRLYHLLPDGGYEETDSFNPPAKIYSITLKELSNYAVISCPQQATSGEKVVIETYDICDGEVKIEVSGVSDGVFTNHCTYEFIMPESDVTVTAWISTEGYAGS